MAKTTARLGAGYRVTLSARSHEWIADEPISEGGMDSGPTPMELLRGALAGCIAITLKLYADRKKWPLEGVEVTVDIERYNARDYVGYTGADPYVHEYLEQIILHGPLTVEQKARLMEIAGKCPVRRAIASPSFFVEELLEAETAPHE